MHPLFTKDAYQKSKVEYHTTKAKYETASEGGDKGRGWVKCVIAQAERRKIKEKPGQRGAFGGLGALFEGLKWGVWRGVWRGLKNFKFSR